MAASEQEISGCHLEFSWLALVSRSSRRTEQHEDCDPQTAPPLAGLVLVGPCIVASETNAHCGRLIRPRTRYRYLLVHSRQYRPPTTVPPQPPTRPETKDHDVRCHGPSEHVEQERCFRYKDNNEMRERAARERQKRGWRVDDQSRGQITSPISMVSRGKHWPRPAKAAGRAL